VSSSSTDNAELRPAGQTEWFAKEVHAHEGQLKAYLQGAFPSVRSDVDDVIQESYLRVWKRHALKPIASVKAFLFTAARHAAIDLLRKNRTSPLDPMGTLAVSSVIDESPNPSDALSAQEKLHLLSEAVAHLPARCYEVLMLHKFQRLSQKEVAVKLGITEGTVANQTRLAVLKCDAYLRSKGVTRLDAL
jgi:RNA polymerase sigma-70 factor (ECF subfamily)